MHTYVWVCVYVCIHAYIRYSWLRKEKNINDIPCKYAYLRHHFKLKPKYFVSELLFWMW